MASVQTTIKTELCSFSECRIYPGRGQKFVAKDGKVHTYIHSKMARLGRRKLKAAKLHWTLVWRRANKKSRGETVAKRRTRKTGRVQKAIVGISLEEIKRTRLTKPDPSKMRKVPPKEPKKEKKDKKSVAARTAPPTKVNIPKQQKQSGARRM